MSVGTISTPDSTTVLAAVDVLGVTLGTSGLVVEPGLSGVTIDIVADVKLGGSPVPYIIDGNAGDVVTIDNLVALGSSLFLDTNGATFILDPADIGASVLSGTTVDINNGGTLQFGTALLTANVLTDSVFGFGLGGGTAVISDSSGSDVAVNLLTVTSPILGFSSDADIIEDQALSYTNVKDYTVSPSASGVQTVTVDSKDGTANLTFAISGDDLASGTFGVSQGPLQLTADNNGLALTLCFLGGTMIATPEGEKPIETLKPGDLVTTATGKIVPVRWIGISTISTRFASALRTMPVRISAGALDENLPKRDLLLSPDHAVLLDGFLVQASALVEGMLIRREYRMPETFRYYHIEVAAHELILAEGVPAETFVDNVSRMNFDNWEEFLTICGGETPTGEMPYPRAKSRRQLPYSLRLHLAQRRDQRAA